MAANKSVTVLTPNGRRPIVKVSPNMTILQILEEVCQKYEYNPDEYDLKHHKEILDVNSIFRYANISNNACLEMVKCNNPRKVSDVTICVQMGNENRVTGEFPPTVNIEKILDDLGVEYNIESAVIIFTQRKIYGKEFQATTLKSLGLANGKALFRLMHRNPEQSNEQAYVYIPPKPKNSKTKEELEDNEPKHSSLVESKSKFLDFLTVLKSEQPTLEAPNERGEQDECKVKTKETTEVVSIDNLCKTEKFIEIDQIPMELDKAMSASNEDIKGELKVQFLGERGALLYDQAHAKSVDQDDVPDTFFDVTMSDARKLLRDARKIQFTLENARLLTAAQREFEKDKSRLTRLHKYQLAIIRIQFPNQLILQGEFNPLENVRVIKDFVRNYLEHPQNDFTLYTAPPRCDLSVDMNLLDQDLVPSAIVYFSGSSDLKPDIKSKLTDPVAANIQAIKIRLTSMRDDTALMMDDSDEAIPSTSAKPASKSTTCENGNATEPTLTSSRRQVQETKAPKWMKLSKHSYDRT